jgi:hypothetical protein
MSSSLDTPSSALTFGPTSALTPEQEVGNIASCSILAFRLFNNVGCVVVGVVYCLFLFLFAARYNQSMFVYKLWCWNRAFSEKFILFFTAY